MHTYVVVHTTHVFSRANRAYIRSMYFTFFNRANIALTYEAHYSHFLSHANRAYIRSIYTNVFLMQITFTYVVPPWSLPFLVKISDVDIMFMEQLTLIKGNLLMLYHYMMH